MQDTARVTVRWGAIALGLIGAMFYSLPIDAQVNQSAESADSLPDKFETGESLNWDFTSEQETISIEDNLKELEQYDVSDTDVEDGLELTEEDRKWGNRGDKPDYRLETDIYNY